MFTKRWIAVAVLAVAPIGVAHAGYIRTEITSGMTSSIAGLPGAIVYDFDDGKPASYSGEGWTLNKSVPGYAAAPAGDTTPYLSVAFPESSGTETFSESDPERSYNYFGLYWGSIDDYNWIEFYNNGTSLQKFTGADFIGQSTAFGDQVSAGSNRFVNFWFNDLAFDQIVFGTGNYAFESDNHTYHKVPEPGTLALMGAGFAAFAFMRRREKKK
jgi:hypothetical protein